MKKRICVTIPTLHGAGCERMLSEVLPFYAEAFDVDLVLQTPKINYDLPPTVNVIDLGVEPNLRSTFSTIKRLRRLFKEKKYDAVVSYLDLYNVTVWLAQLFWPDKPPHIAVEQTTDREFFANSRMGPAKQWIYKFLLKIAYRRVDRVIAVSHNLADFLSSDLSIRTPITVIHNAVDPEKFNIDPPHTDGLATSFLEAKIRILSISRHDHQKNIPFLLTSFAAVARELPEAKLFILGTGPLFDDNLRLVGDLGIGAHVHFLGFRSNPEDYLKLADLFVIASRYESFGNVVVEALACGAPVVTTNYGRVINEIITSDKLGTIVSQGEIERFGRAIRERLNAPVKDKRQLSAYALERFNVQSKASKYLQAVYEVISV